MSIAFVRRLFCAAAAFNFGGMLLFAFPDSTLGALAGLPAVVPALYKLMVALFVSLFGGMYVWLALQPIPLRPMVWLSAIGKAGAFLCVFFLWIAAEAPSRSLAVISIDLIFAALFFWWLVGTQQEAPSTQQAVEPV